MVVCCSWFVVRCLLFVVCSVLFVPCCKMVFVVCCLYVCWSLFVSSLFHVLCFVAVVRGYSFDVGCVLFVMFWLLLVCCVMCGVL